MNSYGKHHTYLGENLAGRPKVGDIIAAPSHVYDWSRGGLDWRLPPGRYAITLKSGTAPHDVGYYGERIDG